MRIRRIFAQNMKYNRKKCGYTQAKLAEMINTSTSFIGEIEICRKFPSPGNIERIAEALGIEPFQLFYDKTELLNDQSSLPQMINEIRDSWNQVIAEILPKYISKDQD